MHRSLVDELCCPHDRGKLRLEPDAVDDGERIASGTLTCARCSQRYAIVDGIARLLTRSLQEGDEGGTPAAADDTLGVLRRQMELRDEESALYDELYDDASYRFEIDTYVTALAARPGELVLDVGCGTGRITKEFAGETGRVVGADFSLESLRCLRSRLPDDLAGRVDLFQCEVGRLPFRDRLFDAVVATSLFSIVPTASIREAGLAELHRVLLPEGRVLITVYNHAWLKRLRQKVGLSGSGRKEGFHSGGRVPYYNFDPAEFRDWVAPYFLPGSIFGLNHRVPVLSKLSPGVAVGLDRLLARLPGSLRICAKEMGMVARKPRSAP